MPSCQLKAYVKEIVYTSENSDDKIFETTSSMSVLSRETVALSSPFIMAFSSCCMSAASTDEILEVEGSMK